jgi:hypothetical protein
MRRMFSLALIVLAITSAAAAFGADNSLGTWKVNIEKTKYTPAPWPVKSVTSVREAVPGGVKVTNTGERTGGTVINSTYTAKYDGSPCSVSGQGSPYDTVSLKQVNANTFAYDAKKTDGKYHAHGRLTISPDGKTLILTVRGTDPDGKPMTLRSVYDKQ